MPEYLSPGVYVEEVPSAVKPIAGVSTSTACFIGLVPETIHIPFENPSYDPTDKSDTAAPPYLTRQFPFRDLPAPDSAEGKAFKAFQDAEASLKGMVDANNPDQPSEDTKKDPKKVLEFLKVKNAKAAFKDLYPELADGGKALTEFNENLKNVEALADKDQPDHPEEDTKKDAKKLAQFKDLKKKVNEFKTKYPDMAHAGQPVLCTSFRDFVKSFGDFSTDGLSVEPGGELPADKTGMQNQLAHAVLGFFYNGGARCYVMRFNDVGSLRDPINLTRLEAIDEISLIAAPGIIDPIVQDNIVSHCENLTNRFAILDPPVLDDGSDLTKENIQGNLGNTDYAALYFPWIKVFDRATQIMRPEGDGRILCAPSGHVAGIYSRVDHERGVHKAPANEVIRGALDLDHDLSRNLQDGLNPAGINCIRRINKNITVWGARTVGGDANTDLKYINVRRTLIFLRESIDRGTQWVVFEPNEASLWAKIVRNVTAFLTVVWRDGALFGKIPEEAFYVKCDEETNPVEDRDLGRVTTEIGVAIVRPAEFVIFRITQWQPEVQK
jgi:uncharacterized protein